MKIDELQEIGRDFPNARMIEEMRYTGDIKYINTNVGVRGTFDNDGVKYGVDLELSHTDFIDGKRYTFINFAFGRIRENGSLDTSLVDFAVSPKKTIAAVQEVRKTKMKEMLSQYNVDVVVYLARDNIENRMSLYDRILGVVPVHTEHFVVNGSRGKAVVLLLSSAAVENHDGIYKWIQTQVGDK